MSHARLLGIALRHAYYKDGLCGDLSLAPTGDTQRLLKNHRCVFKPKANGADLYVETGGDGKPKIPFAQGISLSFDLRLKNPEFPLFTDFSPFALPSGGGDFQITTCYPGPSGVAEQAFARINIRRDFNQVGTENIAIAFSAKPVLWVFYVITDQAGSAADFSITAHGSQSFIWKQSEGTDRISQKLADHYPGMARLRFVSEQSIPCRESGLQQIQLLFRGASLIESLPNPSWRNYFQMEMEAGGGSVDAIFQVVKLLSNTTLTKV